MGLKEMIEGFIFKKALGKGVKVAVSGILSLLASVKIASVMTQMGISIDPAQLEQGLTIFGTAALTMLLNYLKVKTDIGKKYL